MKTRPAAFGPFETAALAEADAREGDEEEITYEKILALAAHLKVKPSTIVDEGGDRYSCEDEPGEYWVLTDDEAEIAWDESLTQYIDDCILPEVPEAFRNYFDEEKWRRDARYDGRGHSLSSYDGEEHEEKIDGTWYYIYRVN